MGCSAQMTSERELQEEPWAGGSEQTGEEEWSRWKYRCKGPWWGRKRTKAPGQVEESQSEIGLKMTE